MFNPAKIVSFKAFDNFGPLRGANGNARIEGVCGDTMEIWVYIENGVIIDTRYITDGCYHSHVSGATAAALAVGKEIKSAEAITHEDVLALLKGEVEEESAHCALLAVNTLKAAILDYRRNSPLNRSGEKKQAAARSAINPKPSLLVSCRDNTGKENALAVAYAGNCSFDPPMVMIAIVPSRYSHKLIKESGCFVVNLTPPVLKEAFHYIGSHSGKNENAPILLDCPVNIECSVTDSLLTGSHEIFIGKIEYVHADLEIVLEDGTIDWDRVYLL